MELPRRRPDDVFLPDGALLEMIARLRRRVDAHDLRIAIVYAFDFRTRMLPYWYADKRVAPASVRTLADVLDAAGFQNLRVILQQWTPNFRPSQAQLNGQSLDILMVSAMQVHAEPAYELIRDARRMGERRPLILTGGPKSIYEPVDNFDIGPEPGIGADCAVTGEVYVLLELLDRILDQRKTGDTPLVAFEHARQSGRLNDIPGLVYLNPEAPAGQLVAVNTGVQRLVRDLDELPLPDAGYRMLEPPHRSQQLRPNPLPPHRVGKHSSISTLLVTQGCKFNCSFCPIPGVNQRTTRNKSSERFAAEIRHIHENFGIREFFGTDDNYFNNRQIVIDMMSELAKTTLAGKPLSNRISFYTEATVFDVHKHQDLLPLCREAGMKAIWFGIEDMTAELVNKGQSAVKTADLFAVLHQIGIQPMALMIHSDDQPLQSKRGTLAGLLNQARYLFDCGAVSYQCTYLGPAVGTRDFEPAAKAGLLYRKVGGVPVPQAFQDGNHVAASRHASPWQKQTNILRAYAAFYNPRNMLRLMAGLRKSRLAMKQVLFQMIGQIGLLMTAPKLWRWARQLKRGPIEVWDGLQKARIPMIDAITRQEINWAIEHLPSSILTAPMPIPQSSN